MSSPSDNGDVRLAEALKAHRRGWALTPLDGKKPITKNWQRQPPPTEDHIRGWVDQRHGLGLRTGKVSRVIAIDDDTEGGSGAKALGLPPTVTVITGSGKRHYYFKAPGQPIGNSASKLHERVDVRGDGGQVVFVGSIHPETGQPYRWLEGHAPDEIEMAELPAHILALLQAGESSTNGHVQPDASPVRTAPAPQSCHPAPQPDWYLDAAVRGAAADIASTPEGARNDTLNAKAYKLGRLGAPEGETEERLVEAAKAAGLPEREARKTVRSGLDAGKAQARSRRRRGMPDHVEGKLVPYVESQPHPAQTDGTETAEGTEPPGIELRLAPETRAAILASVNAAKGKAADENGSVTTLEDAHDLLDLAREASDVGLLLKRVDELADLSLADEALFFQAVREAFGKRFNKTELAAAIHENRRAKARQQWEVRAAKAQAKREARREEHEKEIWRTANSSRRARIELNTGDVNRDPKEVHDDAVRALEASNNPEHLFLRGGRPARIGVDEENQPTIERIKDKEIQSELLHCAIFIGKNENGDSQPVNPPTATIRTLLGCGDLPFPRLAGIVRAPVLRRDGSILMETGYDTATGLYYQADSGLIIPVVPCEPSKEEVSRARELILEVFSQFPFVSEASRANSVALLLTSFLQPVVDDNRPLCAITALQPGAGKGEIAGACSRVSTGRPPRITRLRRDEEFEKKLAHLMYCGTPFICIDNAKGRLESETLESTLTTRRFSDRRLGRNDDGFDVPQDATWCATGNNLELGTEMARRSYLVELDPKDPHPEDREGPRPGEVFKRLPGWVMGHRGELIWAALTLCRAWFAAGCPRPKLRAFGSFDRWQDVVGGVLDVADIPEFLANRSQLRTEQDEERRQWSAFIRQIRASLGGGPFTTRKLKDTIVVTVALRDALPDELASLLGKDDFVQQIGTKLSKRKGTRLADDGLRVVRLDDDGHDKVAQWQVLVGEEVAGGAA